MSESSLPTTTEPNYTDPSTKVPVPDTANLAYSYEYGVDLYDKEEKKWLRLRFLSEVKPSVTYKETDGATYDDLGADHPIRTGETPSLTFDIQAWRNKDGNYLPEVELLMAAAAPGANGAKASVLVRYYDKPASGNPNKKEAYWFNASVSAVERKNTGNSDVAWWSVTLNGQGPRHQIANPYTPEA